MKIRVMLLASAIGSLCVSTGALADPPIGSRLGQRTTTTTEKREREAALGAQEMARCLVNKQNAVVRQYLAELDSEQSKRLDRKMDGEHECFSMTEGNDLVEGRMVTFPHDIFRGMLAEWVIKADMRTFAILPALPRQLIYSRVWYPITGREVAIDEMATCVSESAPAETLGLLKTVPYSDDEGAVFGALGPHLGACLRAGARVTGNRQSLRAALADALYQRVVHPAPPPAVAPASSAKQPSGR